MDGAHRRFRSKTRTNYYFSKFKKKGHLHTVVPNLQYYEGKPTAKAMRSLFKSVFKHLFKDAEAEDWVQLHIEAPSLSNENLNTVWMRKRELTIERFMGQVEATLQSQTTFALAEEFRVEVKHVEVSGAKGRAVRPHGLGLKKFLDVRKRTYLEPQDFAPPGTCVPAAIVYILAYEKVKGTPEYLKFRRMGVKTKAELRIKTWSLCRKAKLDVARLQKKGCTQKDYKKLDAALGDSVGLRVYSDVEDTALTYDTEKTGNGMKYVNLFQDGTHCRGIKDVRLHVNCRHFCHACQMGFQIFHICRGACKWCGNPNACKWPESNKVEECAQCHISGFRGAACLKFHREKMLGHRHSRCEVRACCKDCKRVVFLTGKKAHKCNLFRCNVCKVQYPEEELKRHVCYMQEKCEVKERARPFVFWDTEAAQDHADDQGRIRHRVNMACAFRLCRVHSGMGNPDARGCPDCGLFSFRSAGKFFTWLFSQAPNKDALCLAHNFGGYDGGFLQEWLGAEGLKADNLLVRGNKILSLKAAGIEFKDSLNFIPIALCNFPQTFGLTEMKKGFFPYLFNRTENEL